MKKLLALLLTFSLCFSTSTTAFAYDGNSNIYGEGETQLLAYSYSTFDVTIPQSIDLTHEQGGTVSITNPNLAYRSRVEVSVLNLNENGQVEMTLDGVGKEGTAYCQLYNTTGNPLSPTDPVLAKISDEDVSNGITNAQFRAELTNATIAGYYQGTMRYAFQYVEY